VFLAPASYGRRSEATFAGIETGTALTLMPMVLAQLPAAGKPSKDLNVQRWLMRRFDSSMRSLMAARLAQLRPEWPPCETR